MRNKYGEVARRTNKSEIQIANIEKEEEKRLTRRMRLQTFIRKDKRTT